MYPDTSTRRGEPVMDASHSHKFGSRTTLPLVLGGTVQIQMKPCNVLAQCRTTQGPTHPITHTTGRHYDRSIPRVTVNTGRTSRTVGSRKPRVGTTATGIGRNWGGTAVQVRQGTVRGPGVGTLGQHSRHEVAFLAIEGDAKPFFWRAPGIDGAHPVL